MLGLVVIIVAAILAAVFAVQNNQVVGIRFFQWAYEGIPVYLVVLTALLLGIVFSWVIHMINSFGAARTIHKKQSALNEEEKKNTELAKKVHQLEVEAAELKAKYNPEEIDEKSL